MIDKIWGNVRTALRQTDLYFHCQIVRCGSGNRTDQRTIDFKIVQHHPAEKLWSALLLQPETLHEKHLDAISTVQI
eukprot:CAMPEP_0172734584 /NCGR_PEP_ID=MMETSP1074-20121228/110215_1 /TAXON_ID=2916 /ORGANISM="Ceratium fusus, Strain PA161109" /LENGTH=75 /DNA_ID=CAMNT_0013563387 /DNA_START=22 /DNA_END=246 /DNA_ORIENTATION=-